MKKVQANEIRHTEKTFLLRNSLDFCIFVTQKNCRMENLNDIKTDKPYKIGYALSGGFIKGFAHLGVMQALLEHDIRPDIISGVSAGALAGVFCADGNEPHEVLQFFSHHKFMDLTSWSRNAAGLLKLDDFMDFLRSNLKAQKLEDLKTPLIVTATDLDHGTCVQFRTGDIAPRIAASCCMPVLFTPIRIGNTDYVDGGVFKNLPASVIRRDCEKVIAINVSPIAPKEYKRNIINIALRSYHFMFRANTFADKMMSDLLIEPTGLEGYNNTELEKAEEIFSLGYKCGNEILRQLIDNKNTIWK